MNIRLAVCLLLSMSLAACSHLSRPSFMKTQEKNYLSAKSIPPLRIPPGISGEAFQNNYPVSGHAYPGPKEISLVPPGIN